MPPPPPPPPPAGGPPPAVPPYGGPPPGYTPYGGGAPSNNYAGFGARLGAVIIDGLVGAVFSIPGDIAFFAGPRHLTACTVNGEASLCRLPTGATIALAGLLWLVGAVAFIVLYCKKVSAGQSWGQGVTGVRIVDANTGQNLTPGRVFGRQIARIVSGFCCYLGYLWMLWDAKKQTWHDKIVNTIVIKA